MVPLKVIGRRVPAARDGHRRTDPGIAESRNRGEQSCFPGWHTSSRDTPFFIGPRWHCGNIFHPGWQAFCALLHAGRAVAVIIDEAVHPPEVLLVQHSYRTKGAWGLPGGSLESGLRNPLESSKEESRDDIIESSRRREVFEELGIEIEIVRLTKIDAVPYVPEQPGPYRLDFYYRCLPKQGFSALREGLGTGIIKPRSPEVRQIVLVPVSRLKEYDLYSSDARILFALLT